MPAIRRSLIFSFAGTYSSLIVNFGAVIILSHILTPKETGIYSIAAGIIGIFQALRDFGVGNFIIQEKYLTDVQVATTMGVSIGLGAALLFIFGLGSGPIATFYAQPRLRSVVLVLSLNFLLVPYASVGTSLLIRDMNFRSLMWLNFASTIVGAVVSIVLASGGYGSLGMAWASVAGIVTGVAGNLILQSRRLLVRPSLKAWRQILHFGVFASGASILNMAAAKVPDMIIGRFLGVAAVGIFSRGNGVITLFDTALMGSVSSVTNSALATYHREKLDIGPLFLQSLGMITAVAWPFLIMLALLAHPMILILFGKQWVESAPIAQILCSAAGFGIIGAICFMLFKAVGAVRKVFHIQAVTVIIHVAGVTIGSAFSLRWAACGFVAGSAASTLLALVAVNQDLGTTWRQIVAAIGKSVALTLAAGFAPAILVFGPGYDDNHLWLPSIIAGLGGATAWLACLFAVNHPLRLEITALIRRFRPSWG
jgi:O-antigen/teichoic acid export membrane protein